MRTTLLAALALVAVAAGCTTLKPSHREWKKATSADSAFETQQSQPVQQAQYQQAQYVQPQGAPAGVQQVGYPAHAPAGGYGYGGGPCMNGNCPGYGGNGHHQGHLHNGGRYGYFNGAHGTPGYPHHHFAREYVGPQGPPTAQVAYPYYTIRGPRDFLLDNPPSIGR